MRIDEECLRVRYGVFARQGLYEDCQRMNFYDFGFGQLYRFVGDNGWGKSSILRMISGCRRTQSRLLGSAMMMQGASCKEIGPCQKIGYAHQNIYDGFSPYGHVMSFLKRTYAYEYGRDDMYAMLGQVGMDVGRKSLSHLSGGMRQKLNIIASLAHRPSYILWDEPTSYLDDKACDMLIKWLYDLYPHKKPTLLLATHDDLWFQKIERFYGKSVAYRCCLWADCDSSYTHRAYPHRPSDLQKSWHRVVFYVKEHNFLKRIRLCIKEDICIVGPSGCGKTTLLRLIARHKSHDGFLIRSSVHPLRVAYVPQNASWVWNPYRTISENMRDEGLASHILPQRFSYTANLYPQECSGGTLQFLSYWKVLWHHPDLLLMDEPTSFMDMLAAKELLCLLWRHKQRYGMHVVCVTHDTVLAQAFKGQIFRMHEGCFA